MPMIFRAHHLAAAGAALAITAMPGAAGAATLCSVSGAQLVFGSFSLIAGLDPAADSDRDTTADLAITCSGDPGASAEVEIQLDGGTTGNPLSRALSGPGQLAYNIYTDVGRTTVWGNGASGSTRAATISFPQSNPSGTATLTAYGRIPRGQRTVPIGSYGDSVLVTIVY